MEHSRLKSQKDFDNFVCSKDDCSKKLEELYHSNSTLDMFLKIFISLFQHAINLTIIHPIVLLIHVDRYLIPIVSSIIDLDSFGFRKMFLLRLWKVYVCHK